jgi:hypothetical protein
MARSSIAIAVALLACALLPSATASRQLPIEEDTELANNGRELEQYYNDVGEVWMFAARLTCGQMQ